MKHPTSEKFMLKATRAFNLLPHTKRLEKEKQRCSGIAQFLNEQISIDNSKPNA
jgi:hypothetical protein